MGRLISSICCAIVGLQALVGVPLAVCVAFHVLMYGEAFDAITINVHRTPLAHNPPHFSTDHASAAMTQAASPGITQEVSPGELSSILESRLQCGSPFAGTALAPQQDSTEDGDFVAALRRIAAAESKPLNSDDPSDGPSRTREPDWSEADEVALCELSAKYLRHIYALAEQQEDDGDFHGADRSRLLARNFRFGIWTLAEEHSDMFPQADSSEPEAQSTYLRLPSHRGQRTTISFPS